MFITEPIIILQYILEIFNILTIIFITFIIFLFLISINYQNLTLDFKHKFVI